MSPVELNRGFSIEAGGVIDQCGRGSNRNHTSCVGCCTGLCGTIAISRLIHPGCDDGPVARGDTRSCRIRGVKPHHRLRLDQSCNRRYNEFLNIGIGGIAYVLSRGHALISR